MLFPETCKRLEYFWQKFLAHTAAGIAHRDPAVGTGAAGSRGEAGDHDQEEGRQGDAGGMIRLALKGQSVAGRSPIVSNDDAGPPGSRRAWTSPDY